MIPTLSVDPNNTFWEFILHSAHYTLRIARLKYNFNIPTPTKHRKSCNLTNNVQFKALSALKIL